MKKAPDVFSGAITLIGRFVTVLEHLQMFIQEFQSLIGRFVTIFMLRTTSCVKFQSLIGRFVTKV